MNIKICSCCKKELLLTEFSKDKSRKDGLYCYCKICNREANKKSNTKIRSTLEGRTKSNEASKKSCTKRYAADPDYRFKCKAYSYKRKKNYGDILLASNIIDEPSVQHHVNDKEIINIPQDIHVMYPTHPKEVHRFMVNQVVEQIYGIKIKKVKDVQKKTLYMSI